MYDIIEMSSPNYRVRGCAEPMSIVIHSIGYTLGESISTLTGSESGVSAHYFIPSITGLELKELCPDIFNDFKLKYPEKVPVISMIPERLSAFHAGVSSWKNWNKINGCGTSLNDCSIGIEFHSEGYAKGDGSDLFFFTGYTDAQIETGAALIQDILNRWDIESSNVLAHSDIAFTRPSGEYKTDPGPLFPWGELHRKYKIGLYPNKKIGNVCDNDVKSVQQRLSALGYSCSQSGYMDVSTSRCINAYRMHFMHEKWTQFNGGIDQDLLYSLSCHD